MASFLHFAKVRPEKMGQGVISEKYQVSNVIWKRQKHFLKKGKKGEGGEKMGGKKWKREKEAGKKKMGKKKGKKGEEKGEKKRGEGENHT